MKIKGNLIFKDKFNADPAVFVDGKTVCVQIDHYVSGKAFLMPNW